MQVCVVRFTKSGLKILATAFDRNLGGNAFDQAMFDHFCAECKETKKIDIKSNARASLRSGRGRRRPQAGGGLRAPRVVASPAPWGRRRAARLAGR